VGKKPEMFRSSNGKDIGGIRKSSKGRRLGSTFIKKKDNEERKERVWGGGVY